MLWEAVDSSVALTTRFGFTDAGHASTWFGETLSEAWDLQVDSCDRLVISASKLLAWLTIDGKGYVAKSAVDTALFLHLADIDALIAWLDGAGIPVAAPIAATNGRLRVDRGDFSVGLYPLVAGDLLDVDDEAQVDSVGRAPAGARGLPLREHSPE
jgi:homoserine kinase type II